MNIDFKTYFLEEFKHSKREFRLYHEWVFDKLFKDMELDDEYVELWIKSALFTASYSSMFVSEMIRVDYDQECVKRARIPEGELKGQVISKLHNEHKYIPLLLPWTKSDNPFLSRAAEQKIDKIKLHSNVSSTGKTQGSKPVD